MPRHTHSSVRHSRRSLDPSPFFFLLSKVPSVSMSEISHIPISRCSTVSRLDRIRTLWSSMLPLGFWKRQGCVASSSAGRRAAPGPCPVWRVDEASLPCVARRFMTQALSVRKREKKRDNLNYEELYNITPSIHGRLQHACLNRVCVNDFRHIAVCFLSQFFGTCLFLYFSLCEFHLRFRVAHMIKTEAV